MIRHKCLISVTILLKRLGCQKKTWISLTSHFLICSHSRFTQPPATPMMSIIPVGMRAVLLLFFLLCYGFKPARYWTLIPAEAINEFWFLSYDWQMTICHIMISHHHPLHAGSVNPFWTLISSSRWLLPMNKDYFYSNIWRKRSRMLSFPYLNDVDTEVPESDDAHLSSLSIWISLCTSVFGPKVSKVRKCRSTWRSLASLDSGNIAPTHVPL